MAGKRLSQKQKLAAIIGSGGLLQEIAARCSVHRATVRQWRDTDPEVAAAIEAERESVTDSAESNLVTAIRAGDLHASKYWLSTIGRSRGFTTRTEVEAEVQTNERQSVVIYLPDNGRDSADHCHNSPVQIANKEIDP